MNRSYKKRLLLSTVTLVILSMGAFASDWKDSIDDNKDFIDSKASILTEIAPVNEYSLSEKLLEEVEVKQTNKTFFSQTQNPSSKVIEHTFDSIIIASENLFLPTILQETKVLYNNREFYIEDGLNKFQVQRHNLSKELRGIDENKLIAFLKEGYLAVNKIENDYTLRLNFRVLGGGPITGFVAYWATKAIAYGTAAAAVTGAIVTTGGGAIGAVTAIAGGAAGTVVAAGAGTTTMIGVVTATGTTVTAAASGGAALVATAIGGAGLAAEAGLATAAVVSSAGSVATTIAAVEAGATTVGLFFTTIPFLP